jgi:biotin transport system substrate-specific component
VPRAFLCNAVGGVALVYLVGIPWLAAVAGLTLKQAALGTAAFLPGDFLKAAIAASVAVTLKRAFPLIEAPPRAEA